MAEFALQHPYLVTFITFLVCQSAVMCVYNLAQGLKGMRR
jgi:hypothetical protein